MSSSSESEALRAEPMAEFVPLAPEEASGARADIAKNSGTLFWSQLLIDRAMENARR
jgi:hypothetical protein